MQLSQALSILSADILRDPSYWVWSRANLTRLINKSYTSTQASLKGFLPLQESKATVSFIAGTQEYSLPADLGTIDSVIYDNRKMDKTSIEDIDDSEWTPSEYYIRGSVIGFYPKPQTTGTATIYYDARFDDLAVDSDTFSTPDQFDYAILYLAAAHALRQQTEFEKATVWEAEHYKEINNGLLLALRDYNYDYHYWLDG